MMFCENCGKQIPDNSMFCEECGAKTGVGAVEQQTPPQPQQFPPQQGEYVPTSTKLPQSYYERPKQGKGWIIGLCLIFGFVLFIVGGFFVKQYIDNKADSGDPLMYSDLKVVPPSVLKEADTSITIERLLEMCAEERAYTGHGVMTIENAQAIAFMYGGEDSEAMDMVKKVSGNKYAADGRFTSYGYFEAGFTEGDLAGGSTFDMDLDSATVTGGVATITETEQEGNVSMNSVITAVFMKDGRVFCHMRADITDGSKKGGITVRFLLDPAGGGTVTQIAPPEAQNSNNTNQPAVLTISDEPTRDDFAWYINGGRTMGLPANAEMLTNLDDVFGVWKMFVWVDPDHIAYSESSYILARVYIDEIGGAVSMKVRELTMVDENGTVQDLSGFEPETYWGGYYPNGKSIYFGEPWCRYIISDFYSYNGKQYAIGTQEVQSGEPCYIALVRP